MTMNRMRHALSSPTSAFAMDSMIFRSDSTRLKSRKTRRARTMRRFDSGPGRGVSKKKSQDVVTVIKSKTFQFDRQKSRHQNATMLKTSSTVKSALNVFSSAVKRLR